MKLTRNSRLIKWAYLLERDYEIPDSTNVCALFWRVFLLTPLKCALFAVLITFLWPIAFFEWLKTYRRAAFLFKHREFPTITLPGGGEAGWLAWRRIKDWKAGVCTTIEIK